MGLIIFVTSITIIAIIAYLLAYIFTVKSIPPYQEPVKCNQDCRQGRDCDCFQRACGMTVEEYDKQGKTTPSWPFPMNKP